MAELGQRGVRKRNFINEKTRAKIQTTQIVKRLTDHMNGEVKMSSTQMRAAEILLRKSLPDLTAVDISGDMQADVTITWGDSHTIQSETPSGETA